MSFLKLLPNFYLRNTKNGINLPVQYELTFRENNLNQEEEKEKDEEQKQEKKEVGKTK